MAKKGRESSDYASTGHVGAAATASFDTELDALFSAATTTRTAQGRGPTIQASSKRKRKAEAQDDVDGDVSAKTVAPQQDADTGGAADTGSDDEDEVESEDEDEEEEAELDDSDDGDIELRYENRLSGQHGVIASAQEDVASGSGGDDTMHDDSDEDSEEDRDEQLVHETLVGKGGRSATKAAQRRAAAAVPQAERDARSIFVGNLSISIATSRSSIKALKKHLIEHSPYPSITRVESIRFRSIPFATPTDDFNARNPAEADQGARKRQRSQAYKQAQNDAAEGSQRKVFLTGSQKRKVAFIKQDVNERADGLNAYVTLAPPLATGIAVLQEASSLDKVERLTGPVLAALLAASANGSQFEDRHLRTDLLVNLAPAQIVGAGLDRIRTADGGMLGSSGLGGGADHIARKKTVFVGNLDFETKEEELRDFFHVLLDKERGPPPAVNRLDFARCSALPPPEPSSLASSSESKSRQSWVHGVRIVRDAATQMGKGFAYVRFLDEECVEEVMAISESEAAFLAAAKAGNAPSAGTGGFRRKLKLKGRPLRVSRCKAPKGHVTSSRAGASSTPVKERVNGRQGSRAMASTPNGNARSRSTGAPTPGGTSPYLQRKRQKQDATGSPTRKTQPRTVSSADVIGANPPPKSNDPLKVAQTAQKKADPARQAKRLAKKNAKRDSLQKDGKSNRDGAVLSKRKRTHTSNGKTGKHASLATRAARLASMVIAVLSLVAVPATGNNEIAIFGPVLCPADEMGHVDDVAARRVSSAWPVLQASSQPRLFSVVPGDQTNGVWLALSIERSDETDKLGLLAQHASAAPDETSTASFPLLSRGHDVGMSPRDTWLRSLYDTARWIIFQRYTLRVDWAPNFPLRVTATVHTPQSMLAHGATTYRAGEHELAPGDDTHKARLAGGTDIDDGDVPRWPCPRLYVHLAIAEEGVAIPPRTARKEQEHGSLLRSLWHKIVDVSEAYIGPLSNSANDLVAKSVRDEHIPLPIPIHVVWEPVYLGFIPATATGLLAVLVPALILAYLFVVPRVEDAIFGSLVPGSKIDEIMRHRKDK